ncbi:hypothetical protein [Micromonospora chalcea]|uniref:hypothetical protein n=1 Tax=Micromonospora chalcea TaxID=1874 RepID=UPI003D7549D7
MAARFAGRRAVAARVAGKKGVAMLHGFVMIVIDGQEKVLRVDEAFTPDRLGVATLDHLRQWAPTLPEEARRLRLVDAVTATEGDWRQVVRMQARVRATPEDFVKLVLSAGVALDGAIDMSLSSNILWGYVIDLDCWGFEVYEGWQQSAHTDGRFWARARRGVLTHPPRMAAVFSMVDRSTADDVLPSREEFLRQVREGTRTLECSWPA